MNIGIVFGGKSAEHEVSVISAMQIINGYTQEENAILPVFLSKKNEFYLVDLKNISLKDFAAVKLDEKKFTKVYLKVGDNALYSVKNNKKIATIEACINVCHGGIGENGELVALFGLCNIPISSGDTLAMSVGFDKVATKLALSKSGIDVLDCLWFYKNEWENNPTRIISALSKLKYPLIVKPARQGSSIGISVTHDARELVRAVQLAFKFDGKVLVEKALKDFCEFNCSALGDAEGEIEVSEVDQPIRVHEILSFEDKYVSGQGKPTLTGGEKQISINDLRKRETTAGQPKKTDSTAQPKKTGSMATQPRQYLTDKKLAEKIRNQTAKAMRDLGLSGVVRVDYLYDTKKKKLYLNEINTVPGSLAFYFWARKSVDINALVNKLIDIAIKRHSTRFNFDESLIPTLL